MNDRQLLAISDELIAFVKELFPKHAEFNSWMDHSKWAYICNICWKLNSDKDRPNKPSRIILVIISREAIEDSNYENRKQIVQEKFKAIIQEKYKLFNADHDIPRYQSPPTEEWLVDSNSLNF
jgi:hypothetical protein